MLGLKFRRLRLLWFFFCLFVVIITLSTLYLRELDTVQTFPEEDIPTELNQLGYQLNKGDVRFKYLNLKGKKGDRNDIVIRNRKTYEKLSKKKVSEPKDFDIESIRPPKDDESYIRASATILCLVRNQEIYKITKSLKEMEKHFNKDFKYPYTFINDEPFSESFKTHVRKYSKAEMEFVVVSKELWDKPDIIDRDKEIKAQESLDKENVMYAKKDSYHSMCRFFSGNFYKVPQLQKYKYYWRLEPSIEFYSDVKYDVFKYLEGTGKIYGFTLALYDIEQSITSLWTETLKFLNMKDNYKYINPNGAFQWLVENLQNPHKTERTGGYSTCHFWSNFEIGSFDFWRSEAYEEYFKHLDSTGNFYYERWGDAPVHSLGLSLFADKAKIHWFRDIGYRHDPYQHCPNLRYTTGCIPGEFCKQDASDQNCLGNWIDYELGAQASAY